MKRKYGLFFCLMILSLLFSTNINAATRTVKLKKNKTVTVYAVKSDKWKLKAVKKLKWTSSKKKVATVKVSKSTGIVKPVSVGTTTIRGKKGKTKYTCKFIVEDPKINKKSLSLDVGKTSTLSISGTKQTIKWSSSDDSVCTVSDTGTVKAIKSGSATITAKVGKYLKYNCEVTVPKKAEVDKYHVQHVEFDYYRDSDNDISYYGLITIHNDGNTYLCLKDCTFDIEDSNGHLLDTDDMIGTCRTVIAPGEEGYFYSIFGGSLKNIPTDTKLVLKAKPVVVRATKSYSRYKVSDSSFKTDSLGIKSLIGRVTNHKQSTVSAIMVRAIYFDSNKNAVGILSTTLYDVLPNTPTSFEISTLLGNRKIREKEYSGKVTVFAEDYYVQY